MCACNATHSAACHRSRSYAFRVPLSFKAKFYTAIVMKIRRSRVRRKLLRPNPMRGREKKKKEQVGGGAEERREIDWLGTKISWRTITRRTITLASGDTTKLVIERNTTVNNGRTLHLRCLTICAERTGLFVFLISVAQRDNAWV